MLTDLKTQNAVAMRELGLEIPIEEVYDANGLSLKDAVVHFGGGCTGEIISSEGLVLTNHHCGYGAIQQHSNVEHDYLTDGMAIGHGTAMALARRSSKVTSFLGVSITVYSSSATTAPELSPVAPCLLYTS